MSTRMSGFVQRCVITKECPETFLLFLYKTPLFPRLVQVLRIPFLSFSLPLSFFLSLSRAFTDFYWISEGGRTTRQTQCFEVDRLPGRTAQKQTFLWDLFRLGKTDSKNQTSERTLAYIDLSAAVSHKLCWVSSIDFTNCEIQEIFRFVL